MPARLLLAALLAVLALAGSAATGTAATCSDYPSQADAQHAVEHGQATISDPDDDGRMCVISPR